MLTPHLGDPLLREISTSVVSCNAHVPQNVPKNNRKKSSVTQNSTNYEVVLHDTVLFPEGGGQPSDIGQIRSMDGQVFEVVEVQRHGGHAVHFVKAEDGKVTGLNPGAIVVAALGDDGYKRRLDHMCMHTSQHLLSALFEAKLNLPTLSWALTAFPTPSYIELPRSVTQEEIIAIQDEVNKLVYEGRQVHVEVEEFNHEKDAGVAVHESGRSVGKALPEDYSGGVKRTVVIDGIDRNPCCGTHLPSLHNLQLFLLPQTENLSRSSANTCRLLFLCGPRLLAHLTSCHNLVTATSGILSCGPPLLPDRVTQVMDERKRAEKRVEELEREVAVKAAKELFDQAAASNLAKEVSDTGIDKPDVFKYHYHRTDETSGALSFLQSISFHFSDLVQSRGFKGEFVIVLSSASSQPSSGSTTILFVSGSQDKLVKATGDGLISKLGAKGGGKGTRWSGKWTGAWHGARHGQVIQDVMSGIEYD
ncbi:ThrRS/AlaRS common domain-containing protein [Rickenella mellea]|uniref:ThrRS/AlaRS common domain-containing protein n=1 Tax=Rickenella mellea TaxID=50990 RepID=A0A4R5XGK1_9AGAM|nr:ThrRS/AlaRS common domain-containing protein [Rickenella mellea]